MKQQEYLFQLIKSLTKSEKRHFKLFSSFQGGNKSYLDLFDQLDNQKAYDEKKLLNGNISPNNLSVAKSYLNAQILRSLRNYHSSMSVPAKVHTYLKDIEILYQKRLVPQGQKTLKKAQSLCLKHELFGLQLVLLNWERRLNQLSDTPIRSEEAIYKEQHSLLVQQNEVIELQSLYNQIIEFKQQYGYARGEDLDRLEAIIDHPALESPDPLKSVRARYYYHIIASNYYYMVGRFEDGYNASLSLVNLDLSAQEDYEYLNATLEHTSSCLFFERPNEALFYLGQVQKIIDTLPIGKYEQMRIKVFYYRSNYELMIYTDACDADKIRAKIEEIEAGLQQYAGLLSKEMEFVIASSITYSKFVLGELKSAKSWNSTILNASKKNVRIDIYNAARIIQLFILAELEQYDVLTYELNSAYRYFHSLHKKFQKFAIELLVIEHMRRLTNLPTKAEIPAFTKGFEERLLEHIESADYHSKEDTELPAMWVRSKVEGVSFLEIKTRTRVVLEEFSPKS